jgi:vacuolar-type H+-ATPase subunit F/Vma7
VSEITWTNVLSSVTGAKTDHSSGYLQTKIISQTHNSHYTIFYICQNYIAINERFIKEIRKKEPVIVLIGKMPKQKLKAGLLSTLFVVVLPEVEPG